MAGKTASTPTAASPTTTAVPPARRQSHASRIVSGRPTTSKACSTPPPVSSRTAAAGSAARASTACVAPRASASSSTAGSRSTATIAPAPASTRPAMTCCPTPPQPTTAARSPMRGRATLRTAPMPGHRAAAEQRGLPQRHVDRQRHDAGGGDDGALGEARDREAVLQRRPVRQRQARGAVHQRAAHAGVARRPAQRRAPGAAGTAGAAGRDHAEHDAIAGRDVHDALADGLDRARALVPEHHRPAPVAETPVGEVQVGVADAAGRDAHEHLARLGRGQLDVLDPDVARARAVRPPSCHPPALERVQVGRDAEPGARRRGDRAVGGDLDDRRQQPVAPLGRPGRRVVRHLDERARRDRRASGAGCRRGRSRSTTCAG